MKNLFLIAAVFLFSNLKVSSQNCGGWTDIGLTTENTLYPRAQYKIFTSGNTIAVLTSDSIFISNDNGLTFNSIWRPQPTLHFNAIELAITNSRIYYFDKYLPNSAFYTDKVNLAWNIHNISSVSCYASKNDTLYILKVFGAILISYDGGISITDTVQIPGYIPNSFSSLIITNGILNISSVQNSNGVIKFFKLNQSNDTTYSLGAINFFTGYGLLLCENNFYQKISNHSLFVFGDTVPPYNNLILHSSDDFLTFDTVNIGNSLMPSNKFLTKVNDVFFISYFNFSSGANGYLLSNNGINWSSMSDNCINLVLGGNLNRVFGIKYNYMAMSALQILQNNNLYSTSYQQFGNSNVFTGKVYYDSNNNNVFDLGIDVPLQNKIIKLKNSNSATNSDANGDYNLLSFVSNDTLICVNNIPNTTFSPSQIPVTTSANHDFVLNFNSSTNDVLVDITSYFFYIPGFTIPHTITYKYQGSTISNGEVRLIKNAAFSLVNSNPSPSQIIGDTIIWNYANLTPFEQRQISLQLQLQANTSLLGNILNTIATINSVSIDNDLSNNIDSLHELVVGSYDPNDKAVEPSENLTPLEISNLENFTYKIRFQNTGTFQAFNVNILDTISNFLDLSSIEIIATSHNCQLKLLGNNIIKFEFNNINLPDSNANEPASHGFVKYRIKPKPNLPLGTNIKNTAYIYFDFNEAIITNTTETKVQFNSVCEIDKDRGASNIVFPNPTQHSFSLKMNNALINGVVIKDVTSKTVLQFRTAQSIYNIESLNKGIYFVEVYGASAKVVTKLIIE